jgi:hypothetical protein
MPVTLLNYINITKLFRHGHIEIKFKRLTLDEYDAFKFMPPFDMHLYEFKMKHFPQMASKRQTPFFICLPMPLVYISE